MGCHTWFYRKADAPMTDEEARNRARKNLEMELEIISKIEANDIEGMDEFFLEHYSDKEQREYAKEYFTEELGKLNSGLLGMEMVCEHLYGDDVKGYRYVEGRGWYVKVKGYHDVFRKYGFPDDVLLSLEETLAYINDPANECTTYNYTMKKLNAYWEAYPDGMIRFG